MRTLAVCDCISALSHPGSAAPLKPISHKSVHVASISDIFREGDSRDWQPLPRRGIGRIFSTYNDSEVRWIKMSYAALAADAKGREVVRTSTDQDTALRLLLDSVYGGFERG